MNWSEHGQRLNTGRSAARRSRLTALLLGSALAFAGAAPQPAAAQLGTIVGRVVDHATGQDLPGVAVTLRATAQRVVTDDAGRFMFTQLGEGTHWLHFGFLGYAERTDSVRVASDDIEEMEVRLTVSPVDLPPIVVTSGSGNITAWLASRGFAKRGLEGPAMLHMTYRQLAVRQYQNLTDVLRNVPGVRIRRLANAGSELLLDPDPVTGAGSCKVDVYLNGSNVEFGQFNWTGANRQSASRPMRFDDLVRIGEIDGIELYGPEDNPVAGSSTCGTLMIWSAALRPTVDEFLTGDLHGKAVDDRTGAALAGVRITIEGTGLSTETDANGDFEILSLLPGQYRVLAEYPEAEPWEAEIDVRAYGIVSLDLRLVLRNPSRWTDFEERPWKRPYWQTRTRSRPTRSSSLT